ncbi:MAG TPA: hypothetical protein VLJ38_02405 [Polyangiaceae bacterium]|nr:hypothetical protein [Polyangiaceae bacterium]
MWSGYRSFLSRLGGPGFLLVWIALVASACAGRSTMVSADDDATAGSGASGGKPGHAGAATGGSMQVAGRGGSAGARSGSGGTGDVPYDDPGCPDAAAPASVIECNVFDGGSSCADGFACKPDVEHPFGTGCDEQTVNMRCVVAGSGRQGDSCEGGMGDCAAGFICVLGAAHGARCLQMCPLDGSTRCPSGYVCGATDADGIGVCA